MKTASGAVLDPKRFGALIACVAVGIYFWDSPLLWPLKLLVVMMHESGHALAALLVGGSVERVSLAGNQSGQCLSLLPPSALGQIVVYSAGYVGSAVAGGVLLVLTLRYKVRRFVLGAAAAWLVVMAALYVRDGFTLLFCAGTATALALGAKYLPADAVDVVNLFIAAFSGLYAVFDLRDDLWSANRAQSDAAFLAQITYVPAIVWAVLWTAASLGIVGWAIWLSVRPLRAGRVSATPPA